MLKKMSIEEDTELRDLVQQSLVADGSLAKIRAQIRACTFMALIEEEKQQTKQSLLNHKVKSSLEHPEDILLFALVHEFLEHYNMHYTLKLYESETYQSAYSYNGRNKLLNDLHLNDDMSSSLLSQLLKNSLKNVPKHNHNGHIFEENHKMPVLDQTFNVLMNSNQNTPRSVASDGKEDTFDGTTTIAEDSIKERSTIDTEKDQDYFETDSNSGTNGIHLVVNDEKTDKSSSKSEKYKNKSPRSEISSGNKSREFVLPSLYTSNLEFDDNLDNYEEDFMSTSDVDLNGEATPLSVGNFALEKTLSLRSPRKENEKSVISGTNESKASSINSDDFDLNSTVEDILKSNSR